MDQFIETLIRMGYDKDKINEFYLKHDFMDDNVFTFKEQFNNPSYQNTIYNKWNQNDPKAHVIDDLGPTTAK